MVTTLVAIAWHLGYYPMLGCQWLLRWRPSGSFKIEYQLTRILKNLQISVQIATIKIVFAPNQCHSFRSRLLCILYVLLNLWTTLYYTQCFIERHSFFIIRSKKILRSIYTNFLTDVAEEITIQNISTLEIRSVELGICPGTELYRSELSIGRNANFIKIGVKWEKELSDFYPKQTWSHFLGPESLCKISSKSNQNCGRRSVYKETDRQTQVIL